MNFTRHNLVASDLIETANLINRQPPRTGYVKAVFARQPGAEWRLFVARCVVTSEPPPEQVEMYRECAFVTSRITDFSLKDFLATVAADGYSVSEVLPRIKVTASAANWKEEIIPSHVTGGFPVKRFSVTASPDACFVETQLVAYGMPFQLSAQRHLKDFICLTDHEGASDSRKGELLVEIEDLRGRIHLEHGRLSISDPATELCIVGQINEDAPIRIRGSESAIVNDKDITSIELWMLTKQNEIVDYWSSSEWQHRFHTRSDGPAYEELLKDEIRKGESESCEFKPYLRLKEGANAKILQIEKTVCALSNHNGGRLFIGIDDEGEVLGLASSLLKDYGGGIEQARATYVKAIQARLREALKDNQCFTIEPIELYGKLIAVITIQKARDLNYLLQTNQAFLRRGATTAKMTPSEIQSFHAGSPLRFIDGGSP
jgi:hypothetical protein